MPWILLASAFSSDFMISDYGTPLYDADDLLESLFERLPLIAAKLSGGLHKPPVLSLFT
jgi:hypothetical protein